MPAHEVIKPPPNLLALGHRGAVEPSCALEWIDPLLDSRWPDLVQHHPRASVFHTTGWLLALQRTYGFKPRAIVSATGINLASAILYCPIVSRLTGRRLVSLPFSDHCEPLVTTDAEYRDLLHELEFERKRGNWKYVELRPIDRLSNDIDQSTSSFAYHRIDLSIGLPELLRRVHPNHVRRKLSRSAREGLRYEEGGSVELIEVFYKLLLKTRRRHGIPPQPFAWFRNVLECLPDAAKIRVAFKGNTPISAVLTLWHRDTMMYKYGVSDSRFHPLGGIQLLLWRAIEEAVERGGKTFDMGRSELTNTGLIAFKEHWGAKASPLVYCRLPPRQSSATTAFSRSTMKIARRVLTLAPESILVRAGRLVYPHIG